MAQAAPAAKKPKAAKDADVSAAQGSSTVFIKNLPWSATEDQIYEFFQECGEAVNVRIGKPLGARGGANRLWFRVCVT